MEQQEITWYSDNGFELTMTRDEAEGMSHQGDCENSVRYYLGLPKFAEQFAEIDPDDIRSELKEYGAWDSEELSDNEMNQVRILWIVAGDVTEGNRTDEED